MDIEPIRENEKTIATWLEVFGQYIRSGEIELNESQLEKAADLVNDIYNRAKEMQPKEDYKDYRDRTRRINKKERI